MVAGRDLDINTYKNVDYNAAQKFLQSIISNLPTEEAILQLVALQNDDDFIAILYLMIIVLDIKS